MSLASLKKELKSFPKDSLEDLVCSIYGKNKLIKEYLEFFLNPDEEKLLEKYQMIVADYMNPKRGRRAKIGKAKAAIREFSKTYELPEMEAELMIAFIKEGYQFSLYSVNTTALENSIASMKKSLQGLVLKYELNSSYLTRVDNF